MKITLREHTVGAVVFLASFGFFQFLYPYHLIRREQMTLFSYDWNYLTQTYHGTGWFGRLCGDFLEQFFHLPVAGPVIIALLLTLIALVTYHIFRKFSPRWLSVCVAAVVFVWSFFRETGNLYTTRYTLVVLGYLSLVLAALQFRNIWSRIGALALFLAIGVCILGSPVHKNYGKIWSTPKFEYERLVGLDAEVARGNWDKVLKLSEKDLYMVESSYCYNLALAMKGELGDRLFEHSQGEPSDLILRTTSDRSTFTNCLAGEAWFRMRNMTLAEQAAITSLQASPNHTGARYIKRLAEVSLIKGDEAAAQKYLGLLSHTLFYGKWARSMMPENQDEETRASILEARSMLATDDFVHLSGDPRPLLVGLLEANPANTIARNYLLCYDLMRYDIDQFMEDYLPYMSGSKLYQEAVVLWLSRDGLLTDENISKYGIDGATLNRMDSFSRMPGKYTTSYWYYYMKP